METKRLSVYNLESEEGKYYGSIWAYRLEIKDYKDGNKVYTFYNKRDVPTAMIYSPLIVKKRV